MNPQSHAAFPSTRWSLIGALRDDDSTARDSAMRELAEHYWPAIYAYLRRHGMGRELAVEVTQAFFVDVVLGRRLFQQADQRRGSLRSLIRTALKRFVIDFKRHRSSGVNAGAVPMDDLPEEDALHAKAGELSPEELFDRRWAISVLQEALRRAEDHYRQINKVEHWQAFETRVLIPCMAMSAAPTHESVAEMFDLSAPSESVDVVRVVRKRLLILLRQVIAETIVDAAEQEEEYRYVLRLLSP